MWPRFTLYDFRIVLHYLGSLLFVTTVSMIVPLVVAILCREWNAMSDFLISIGITGTVAGLFMLVSIRPGRLSAPQAILLTGLAWIFMASFGAIPLWLSGEFAAPIDALFESVSGFTTTGVSLMSDVNHLPYSLNIWRLLTHVIGGQGIVSVAMSLGIFSQSMGAGSLYRSEGRTDSVLPNIVQTIQFAVVVTVLFVGVGTLFTTIAIKSEGVDFLRALYHGICLSTASFGTGGFTPMSNGIMYYHSIPLEIVLMVLMSTGAMNFALYYAIWHGGGLREFGRDIEVRTLIIWTLIVMVFFSVSLARDPVFSSSAILLRKGVFLIVGASSNTGFASFYPSQLSGVAIPAVFFTVILAMAMGGATGSTAGGIKAHRMAILAKTVIMDVKAALAPVGSPTRVRYHHLGEKVLTPQAALAAMLVVLLFLISFLIGSVVAVALGYPPAQAIFESVAMTTNAGLTSGISSPDMPLTLKILYIVQMWGGRLEFMTLISLGVGILASLRPRSGSKIMKRLDTYRDL